MAPGPFREEYLLGTGGMAEVWRASGPSGPVAVKRLLPHSARNPSVVAAFEREGRLLQRIQHLIEQGLLPNPLPPVVNDDCTATLKLTSGQTYNAVVTGGGKGVLFIETDSAGAGVVGFMAVKCRNEDAG